MKAKQPEKSAILTNKFDIATQVKLNERILELLGVEKSLLRMDVSTHPFCTHFHPTDVRITTRYNEHDLCLRYGAPYMKVDMQDMKWV